MLFAQIETFLAIARTGNVSRAAELLFVTQPAVTVRLRQLEADLGEKLFERSGKGMVLTEAGLALLPFAERAVNALRDGREHLERLRHDGGGSLVVAAAPGVSAYALPAILERFTTQYPNVEIKVKTGHTEDVLDLVLREEVQLGIGRSIRHPDIVTIPLYEDELVLVVPRQHWLGPHNEASLEDIVDDRLILFDRESSYYEMTEAMFRSAGIKTPRMMELDNLEAAKRMVEHGLGVALLPRVAVIRDVAEGRMRLVSPIDGPAAHRQIVAFRRRNVSQPSAVANFLQIAQRVAG
jgi:DNA-binding transcriptional LysR family regulator